MKRASWVVRRAAMWVLPAVMACGTNSATAPGLLEPDDAGEAFEGVQCDSVRPPTEPDLMAWDAGSRANLESLHERGVVAVRYSAEGCNVELEVLECVGEGEYSFSLRNDNYIAPSTTIGLPHRVGWCVT